LSDCVRNWKFGWSGRYPKCYPADHLQWHNIRWSKLHGYRYVDQWQVDPEVVRAVSAGRGAVPDRVRERRMFGSTVHKMAFGGEMISLPKPYCLFLNPALNATYGVLAGTLLSNRHVRRAAAGALHRVWSKAAR
jgi:hypothetical protein